MTTGTRHVLLIVFIIIFLLISELALPLELCLVLLFLLLQPPIYNVYVWLKDIPSFPAQLLVHDFDVAVSIDLKIAFLVWPILD